jgi:hypothetical protein
VGKVWSDDESAVELTPEVSKLAVVDSLFVEMFVDESTAKLPDVAILTTSELFWTLMAELFWTCVPEVLVEKSDALVTSELMFWN